MAITHATWSLGMGTDTSTGSTATGDQTYSHAGDAAAKAAIVCVQSNAATNPVTGVLYGGTAMTKIDEAIDTTEAGYVAFWFLGDLTGLTGTQTVTLQGCTADQKHSWASTLTAATPTTQVSGFNSADTQSSANPSINVVSALEYVVYAAMSGGAAAPSSYVQTDSLTARDGTGPDYGTRSGAWARSGTRLASTATCTFAFATSDDWCMVGIAVAEIPVTPIPDVVHAWL